MSKEIQSNTQTFSWMNPKLEVRSIGNGQGGVFAREPIEKGERLAIFGGYILTLEEESKLPEEFQDTGVQIAEDFVITSKNSKEPTDFFNHSCDPNAGFEGQIFLVAMKDINSDFEIVFDYAMALYASDLSAVYKLDCTCGAQLCRQTITSDDWKIPELQLRYADYFQQFLKRKISNTK